MIAILHDVVRAALVLVVLAVGCEIVAAHRDRPASATPPAPSPAWQPAWQPQPQAVIMQAPPERPIRRVASALTELGDSVIGVIR